MNSAMFGQLRPSVQSAGMPSYFHGGAAVPQPSNRMFQAQISHNMQHLQAQQAAVAAAEEARMFRVAKMEAELAHSMAAARFKAAAASNAARMSLIHASSLGAAASLRPQHHQACVTAQHPLGCTSQNALTGGAVVPLSPARPASTTGSPGSVPRSPVSPSSGLDLLSELSVAAATEMSNNNKPKDGGRASPSSSDTASTSSPSASDSSSSGKEGGKTFIDTVREWDVLCGRGGKSNHHPGNKRYRQVVGEMKMMYRRTEAKAVKTDVSRCIVEHVLAYGGRFVKKDEKSGRYYILTRGEARKKTSQALRETKELKWTL